MNHSQQQQHSTMMIRGVNLGGWLVAERSITPYLFALTSCHVNGDFCWYPHQLSAPSNAKICDLYHCKPLLEKRGVAGIVDYPTTEHGLLQSFPTKTVARRYMEFHWNNFVSFADILKLQKAGVTHLRVPMGPWIIHVEEDEPYVVGGWIYFIRLTSWCRKLGIQVWPDLLLDQPMDTPNDTQDCGISTNGNHTLRVVKEIANAIVTDGLSDVVTGVGITNSNNCNDANVTVSFNKEVLRIVQATLGQSASVTFSDNATFDNATALWSNVAETNKNIYLETAIDRNVYHDICQDDNATYSTSLPRIISNWSATIYADTSLEERVQNVMKNIAKNGTPLYPNRPVDAVMRARLLKDIEVQMVSYEKASNGWFYWTLKTEGGAFASWNFLRGIEEGWIPNPLPNPNEYSESKFGTCKDILNENDNIANATIVANHSLSTSAIVDKNFSEVPLGNSTTFPEQQEDSQNVDSSHSWSLFSIVAVVFFMYAAKHVFFTKRQKRNEYMQVHQQEAREMYV